MAAKSALFDAADALAPLLPRHDGAAGNARSSWASPTSVALAWLRGGARAACGRLALAARLRGAVNLATRAEAGGDRGRCTKEDELVLRSEESDEEGDAEEEEEEEMMVGEEEVAEELEGLEEEAMTSGDEGREPSDYDRRAHIFDQSSRVFRGLKERHDRSQQHQQ